MDLLHHSQHELDHLDQTEHPRVFLKGSWGRGREGRTENKVKGTVFIP